ncbi:MAG: ABC transporter permease [Longimicrobiales bacterium]
MTSTPDWQRLLRSRRTREQVEEEVEAELRFHLDNLVDRYRREGMSESEAWARVASDCGDLAVARTELAAEAWKNRRRARRRERLDGFLQDLKLSVRQIRRRPGFAAVVILILGLGIGANSAMFSVLRSVVLTPLPYPEPDRLMTVWTPWEGYRFNPVSALDWADLREGSTSFQDWGIFVKESLNLSGEGAPEQVAGVRVSPGVLRALKVEAARGRLFLPDDAENPIARVTVISHGLWQRRFGSDPDLLGRDILINQEPWTVIGIFPPEFRFPDWGTLAQPDAILPISIDPETADRGSYYLGVLGRLADDRSREQAHEELNGIAARLAEAYPDTNGHRVVQVVPLREIVLGLTSGRLWILLGVTGLVLLLACANVGGLLVARNLGRQVEVAIRASLGAGRGRLIRQLLTEALTLALLAGGVGLLLAWLGTDLLARLLPADLQAGRDLQVDGLVVSVTVASALLTSVLTGVIPAFASSAVASAGILREGARALTPGKGRGRMLGSMVVVQFALAFVLVDVAVLMLQSLREVTSYRELAEPEKVLVAGYLEPSVRSDEIFLRDPFLEDLLQRLDGLPGVRKAGATTTLPLRGLWTSDLLPEGLAYDPDIEVPSTQMIPVSPGYFEAMGIELLRGRDLNPDDLREGAVGVVVNEAYAARSWPGESPLGKRIRANAPVDPWLEAVVVGVVEDVRQRGLESAADAALYLPFFPSFQQDRWVAIRAAGDPLSLVPSLRETFSELDSHRPITQVFTGRDLYSSMARGRSATTRLFGLFALLSISLAAAGTFGVMSFFVGQKLREMGIRMALGAGHTEVAWSVLRAGLVLAGVGTGIGLLGVWGVAGVLQNLLYGVGATDPLFLALAGIAMGLVCLSATGLPALRASRTDPVDVMRAE